MTISLQGDDSAAALDRLEIPADLRQKISERLTPGSSLIVGDTAINTASLPKGADFLVWAKDTPAKITAASLERRRDAAEAPQEEADHRAPKQLQLQLPLSADAELPRLSVLALVASGTARELENGPARGRLLFRLV